MASVQHTEASGSSGSRIGRTSDSGTGEDTLVSIENVKGTHGNDFIDGDGNANLLKGLDGEDVINGHGGDDTIIPNRPAGMNDDGESVSNAAADATPAGTDGADMVDGGDHGDKGDTISYEGESAAVTIDLGTIVPAEGGTTPDDPTDDVDAHVAATVSGVTDMIKVVENAATEDEDDQVSTIENVTEAANGGMDTVYYLTLVDDADTDGDESIVTATTPDGVEMVFGTPNVDNLTASADGAAILGRGGNDTLFGCAGKDMLTGGGRKQCFRNFQRQR